MHEVSLMEETLKIAQAIAFEQGAKKIYRLTMSIGTQSGVVPEALRFAFDVVSRGTLAEGGELEIKTVSVSCYCKKCEEEFFPSDFIYICPQCQQISQSILKGKEIELTTLEVL